VRGRGEVVRAQRSSCKTSRGAIGFAVQPRLSRGRGSKQPWPFLLLSCIEVPRRQIFGRWAKKLANRGQCLREAA
jgi:hypothetical protein